MCVICVSLCDIISYIYYRRYTLKAKDSLKKVSKRKLWFCTNAKRKNRRERSREPTLSTSRFYFNSLIERATFQLIAVSPERIYSHYYKTTLLKWTLVNEHLWLHTYIYVCMRTAEKNFARNKTAIQRIGSRLFKARAHVRACTHACTRKTTLTSLTGIHIQATTIISNGLRYYKSTYMRPRPPRWNRPRPFTHEHHEMAENRNCYPPIVRT